MKKSIEQSQEQIHEKHFRELKRSIFCDLEKPHKRDCQKEKIESIKHRAKQKDKPTEIS